MKAKETGLFPFLNGTKQFVIPIYQRTYSWTKGQCQQLWDDIVRLANNPTIPGHFIGSVVYVEGGVYDSSVVPQLQVIDGQQRLTTLSLLLAALGKAIEERAHEQIEVTRNKLRSYYLLNEHEDGDLRYKLLLTQSDKTTLMRIIDDHELGDDASPRLRDNYRFLVEQLRQTPSLQAIFNSLTRLIVVDISLERDKDNPQLIFESLNSTGLKLTQADLIRNYILMGQPHGTQIRLYNDHWYPMEQRFGHAEYANRFDRFMRDYLTIKLGRIPNMDAVYDEFKRLVQQQNLHLHDVVADIGDYSGYYVQLSFARATDQALNAAIRNINTLQVDVSYPFLIECLRAYQRHELPMSDLLSIFRLCESYVFRRAICGIPTNSLNKTFANLWRDMHDKDILEHFGLTPESAMVERLEVALLDKDSYRRFPNDEEFRRELLAKDINNFHNRIYLLHRIENYHHNDRELDSKEYMIVNIIPATTPLPEIWQQELGPEWELIQARHLNRLSNLAFAGFRQEPDRASFAEKRDMPAGFRDTPVFLNRALEALPRWNEAVITARAEDLALAASKVWVYPQHVPLQERGRHQPTPRRFIVVNTDQSLPDWGLTDSGFFDPDENDNRLNDDGKTALESEYLQGELREVYSELRRHILNLDVAVREEPKRRYIAFKTDSNFVDVVPQRSRLRLSLNMPFSEINDPQGVCKDITNLGRWGNGDVEVGVSSPDELDYAIDLIRQALDYRRDNV